MNPASDPFRDAREKSGVLKCPFHGEDIVMLLRHEDVRRAAKDWQTFSSDVPFRVPIPSEEDVRTMRQLPIETNPPEHTEYRAIVEPFFQRPKDPAMIAQVEALIEGLLTRALGRESIEIVHEFALPIQSRALTYLLNVPESEAETWIGWGIHVFKVTGGLKKGVELEEYLHAQFDRAEAKPGEDFFSALAHGTFRGRQLTRDEMMGFANLAFAGGRDTIIHTIACALGHFAAHPEALEYLRADPKRIGPFIEEVLRLQPPTHGLFRTALRDVELGGATIPAGAQVCILYAAANEDETAFPCPEKLDVERKNIGQNLTFGAGIHRCIGIALARMEIRVAAQEIIRRLDTIRLAVPESELRYLPTLGTHTFEKLPLTFTRRS